MASRLRRAGVLAVLGLLAACGGGDDPAPAPAFTLSGTVSAAAGTRVDGDTADPRAPVTLNDTFGTAQPVPSAVTVGGWASSSLDPDDWYRATMAAGQGVTLAIANPLAADLDLGLFAVSDPGTVVAVSAGTGPTEWVGVPSDGEYFVRVNAFAGSSNYILTLGQSTPAAAPVDTLRLDAEFVPGEVIVRFRDDVLLPASAETPDARAASVGLLPLAGGARREMLLGLGGEEGRARAFAALGIERAPRDVVAASLDPVRAAELDTLRVVKALRRRADVAGADPNYVHRASRVPNDTYFSLQWHYPAMRLPQAWEVTTGSPQPGGQDVIVAVVDTGVVLAHPDLSPKLVPGFDFISDPARARDLNGIDSNPDDPGDAATPGNSSWHGTHVAGTVAAATDNGRGVAGVSWGAKIMPIRVLGVGGGTSYDILQGIRFAARLPNDSGTLPAQKADVVNLSLGCLGCFSTTSQAVYDQVRAAGVVVVAAAGNENTSQLGYPASYAGVVSVSAVDLALARAPYSNFGPTVDVAAPGGNMAADRDANGYGDGVLSTIVDDADGTRQAAYSFLQGTSMASPHVAGVVALMKSVCPSLTPPGLDALLATPGSMTVDLGAAGRDDVFGHGLVDALAAVRNCGTTAATTLGVTPGRIDFGTSATALPLTASALGSAPFSVTAVSDDATWLAVTPAPGSLVNGLGVYTATASRAGLVAGVYAATITFTTDIPSTVAIPVTLQVGAGGGTAGNAGHLYVLLVNETFTDTVAQAEANASGGLYPFVFGNVPAGLYYVVAGTDSDDDDFICDDGEACGAYPTLGLPTPLSIAGNRPGIDFTAGFDVRLDGAALGTGAAPRGFPLLRPVKRVEVRP